MLDKESFEATVRANAFANYNNITVRQLELGKAESQLTVGPDNRNPLGKLHGGAYYTLADCAAGTACRTDGRRDSLW